jgi:hypothetical protein
VPGSGCTLGCSRNLIGKKELTGKRECPGAWTLDNPPRDVIFHFQPCSDGAACDFDGTVNGECEFSVGICLNRPQPTNCQQAPILAVDLLSMRTGDPVHAAACETLTDALAALTAEIASVPGRCRDGETRKNCTINRDCDSFLGATDGICDVPTGVSYHDSLTPFGVDANQTTACTPGQPVVVPLGTNLRLRMFVRREGVTVKGDKVTVRLLCVP